MFERKLTIISALSLCFLSACGSGSDSDEPVTEEPQQASFSLAISDAPVDALSEVVVCFSAIELNGPSGKREIQVGDDQSVLPENDVCVDEQDQVVANTVGINLLDYTGSDAIQFVDNLTIESGQYTQMRLQIATGSYAIVEETSEKVEVSVPSNELKFDGFTASAEQNIDFTLEFDLRMAMTNPVGQSGYFLKPRGVRLVDNLQVATISGNVSETLLLNNLCVPLATANVPVATVYMYQGQDLELSTLADIGGSETNQPIAVSAVQFKPSQTLYTFEIGFVELGDYTLAVSCETVDNPESDDDVSFITTENVSLTEANQTVEVAFDVEAQP